MRIFNKKLFLVLIIFIVSLASYYYPIHKKGYEWSADYLNLIEARNLERPGVFRSESEFGIILSSEHIKESGVDKGVQNPITPIIYSWIFKAFGLDLEIPIIVSILSFSIFNSVLFLLLSRIITLRASFIAAVYMAIAPFMVSASSYAGYYEFSILFFVIALMFYFGNKDNLFTNNIWMIFVASIFFALAALSRNAFAISFIPFLLFDLYINRSWKRGLALFLPFFVIFGSTLTPYSWLGVSNGYNASIDQQTFQQIGHFFPDSYTLHFNRDQSLNETLGNSQNFNRVRVNFADHYGQEVKILDRLKAILESFKFHATLLFDLTILGGPIIILIILFGAVSLWKNNRNLFYFFSLWLFIWLSYLTLSLLGNWNHVLELFLVISLLVGLGLEALIESIKPNKLMFLLIMILFIGHMSYATKWRLFDVYRSSKTDEVIQIVQQHINNTDSLGTYAVGIHPEAAYAINYYTNNDTIYFNPNTIESLIENKKIKEVFNQYDIKVLIGYSPEISSRVKKELNLMAIPSK